MTFKDFVKAIQHEWKQNKDVPVTVVDPFISLELHTRDTSTGHWKLNPRRKRIHIHASTVLYTDSASDYEFVDVESRMTQT